MLPDAPEQSPRQTGISRLAEAIRNVALDALILLEVLRDEIGCFLRTDTELLSESERSLTIHDSKVDCLRALALCRRNRIDRQSEHRGCCTAMDIFTGRKRLSQSLVTG